MLDRDRIALDAIENLPLVEVRFPCVTQYVLKRDEPTNCQHEPPYPGDPTVVFSMRAPGLTVHRATTLCSIQEPHAIAECREWNASDTPTPKEKR